MHAFWPANPYAARSSSAGSLCGNLRLSMLLLEGVLRVRCICRALPYAAGEG
jgi:hypothetical protein